VASHISCLDFAMHLTTFNFLSSLVYPGKELLMRALHCSGMVNVQCSTYICFVFRLLLWVISSMTYIFRRRITTYMYIVRSVQQYYSVAPLRSSK